jgi:tetratricopeptide (TPR) repeat protein
MPVVPATPTPSEASPDDLRAQARPAPSLQDLRMMTWKKLSFCALFFLPHPGAFAQEKPYDDLLILYVDEKYEKCLQKADRYVNRDATHKDALPYLYESMCYFEMSKIPKYQEMDEYKHADRDALKWASKYRRKDKEKVYFANYEDYWTELNTMAQEVGFNYLDEKNYSKARLQFKRMTRYDPENAGAWRLLALSQSKMRLARDASESMKEFEKAYAAIPNISQLPIDQKRLLREGLVRSAEQLENAGQLDSARATLDLGKDDFMKNPEFKGLYEELEGSASK